MACREYTLPREESTSQPKGWIQGSTKIGPVLEVTTSCLYGKHGVEIRIWSLSEDNTHSWVRISHGSSKFVMDSNNNDTEVPEDQPEEQAFQLNAKDFACRSKANAEPQRREPASYSPSIIPMNERNWIDIEPGKYDLSEYEVSKKVIHLFRHSLKVHREELMIQEQLFISELFKDIQDAILLILHYRTMCGNSERILPSYLPCWMCIQSALYHQLWIDTWRSKFEQETDSILPAY